MKAKRFAATMITLLVVFSLMHEVSPAFALPGVVRPVYPWKINYINQSNDISSISMIFDGPTLRPRTFFYNNDLQMIYEATFVGGGSGNCGTQSAWQCLGWEISARAGENDTAYHLGAAGKSFLSGLVNFDPVNFFLSYREIYGTDPAVTLAIFDLDTFSGTVTPKLAYGPDGFPHIVVLIDKTGFSSDQLVYIHRRSVPGGSCSSSPWNGSSLWDCVVIKQGFSVARDPSIAVDDAGDVHIAYYDPIGNDLEYATNARGAWDCGLENGWHCVTVESAEGIDTGAFPSIAAGSVTYIAYYNRTAGELRLAKWVGLEAPGANCGYEDGLASGYTFICEEIDTIGSSRSQVGISLALDNAEPVIAYSWGTEITRLKLAQRSQRIGAASGNCGELHPGDLFLHWQCDVINDNSPYSLGDEIDLAVNPSGVTYIAYLEDNYIDQEEHLKVAYQYIPKFVYIPLVRR